MLHKLTQGPNDNKQHVCSEFGRLLWKLAELFVWEWAVFLRMWVIRLIIWLHNEHLSWDIMYAPTTWNYMDFRLGKNSIKMPEAMCTFSTKVCNELWNLQMHVSGTSWILQNIDMVDILCKLKCVDFCDNLMCCAEGVSQDSWRHACGNEFPR